MELWNILDENGNPTGVTLDKNDKRAWEKGAYNQGVDAWIINSENKILIQKRAPQKVLFFVLTQNFLLTKFQAAFIVPTSKMN